MGTTLCAVKEPIDVPVPDDQRRFNGLIQVVALMLYTALLMYVLHNTYRYLWVRGRYKIITHSMFYTFAMLLALCRILEHSLSFQYYVTYKLRFLNNMADGFSICIGIAQVVVVAEIVFAMELFKTEMVEVKSSVE